MGQLSAYRFPESSGWEKVWSWTNDSDITTTYTKIPIPYEKFDKDLYFITFGGFKSTTEIVDDSFSIYLYFSPNNNLKYDSGDVIFAENHYRYATIGGNVLNSTFSIGAEKNNTISYWNSSSGTDYTFRVNNGDKPQSNYHYLGIWLSFVRIQSGATIDFYGMNLPK